MKRKAKVDRRDHEIVLHGHFYQPARENPWLEVIELQDSAAPFHDWNERVGAECYAPNASARILDDEGWIVRIVNNYAQISFNFGSTLLGWLEARDPNTYEAILEADRCSRDANGGHGSALAQPYNHMILPLATRRDKVTQVAWGIQDFAHRFGRRPEGMWLPETAVDTETLEVLAEAGIAFTVLAPHQAARVRRIGENEWVDVSGGQIVSGRSYRVPLPSGNDIAAFFYNGPLSQAVAFEGLLRSGERFAERLVGAFSDAPDAPLVHIATDGETYGHHHRHGDMALAYALDAIASRGRARVTNYGSFLERHPPRYEAEIVENSSWSCPHGVERWRSDCGCTPGGRPEWNQGWRAPLREALDGLRDALAPAYERHAQRWLADPWAARDDYVRVVLDRSPDNVERFFADHGATRLSPTDTTHLLRLLELQRHAMLMYTSCGWFFDELSRTETVQVLQYAGRAIQLAQDLFGDHLEDDFLAVLEGAESNVPEQGNGRQIYERYVRPARVDLVKVGAHFAISSMFVGDGERDEIYCYRIDRDAYGRREVGRAALATGRTRVTSKITGMTAVLSFAVLHFGDHNISGGVLPFSGESAHEELIRRVTEPFDQADLPAALRQLDDGFGPATYSLRSLFRDEQRRVLDRILETMLTDVETQTRQVHENHAALTRFLADLGAPIPEVLRMAASFTLNRDLVQAVGEDKPDLERIRWLFDEARIESVPIEHERVGFAVERSLTQLAGWLYDRPEEQERLSILASMAGWARSLPFEVDLWRVQNVYYDVLQEVYPRLARRSDQGDEEAAAWCKRFGELGAQLRVRGAA